MGYQLRLNSTKSKVCATWQTRSRVSRCDDCDPVWQLTSCRPRSEMGFPWKAILHFYTPSPFYLSLTSVLYCTTFCQVWFSNRRARWRKQMTSGQVVGYGASDVSFTSSPPLAAAATAATSPFSLPLPSHTGIPGTCYFILKLNTHRRRDETVLSRRVGVGGVYMNSRRLPTDSATRTHNAAVGRDPVHDCRRVCSHRRHHETVAN